MRKPVILITGANGEIGHGLINHLGQHGASNIVAIDLNQIDEQLARYCTATIVGDILDENLLQRMVSEYEIHQIYHLAALLSTRSEYTPARAHRVNVEGTLNLLQLAHEQSRWHGHTVKFLFPSSIAAYGLPDRATKMRIGRVRETDFNFPTTMYGCNKLYCEQLGRYFTLHFRQLSAEQASSGVDFRALRFPGLISATTIPSGGTSDYAPEMLHAAAKGEPYECFVDEGAQLPFMVMPDAIKALTMLADAPAERLTQRVYNVTSFSFTAGEFRDRVLRAFPNARITFKVDVPRARIVDSWPANVDDMPARDDWGWKPDYDLDRAFDEYLVPTISRYYQK
ncbi:MAG: NAD-dependent epimerase/dehydratase family protein [Acidobacteriota bacterium]|nr:NAD-dependent epimerase/dehydratase family protein [Blastocatellia bacterium]MDW8239987.1 NAD-dependent epimerase/dehydratase family protein [Acidobacteriota bacterium]